MKDYAEAKKVAGMLAAVAEPTRLLILYQLAHGPHHVGALAELIGTPMVNMSHHLGVMRQAGLLEDEKEGRRVVYRFRSEICLPDGESDALTTLSLGGYRLVVKKGMKPVPETKARGRRTSGRKGASQKVSP